MKKEIIAKFHQEFENIVRIDIETDMEFWLAREIQKALGYTDWRNFQNVIEKAKQACENSQQNVLDHFVDIDRKVLVGSGGERVIDDIAMTRYACYLVAQNGDPSKDAIAFAQTYFAVQTRKQELIEKRIDENERLRARKKLSLSEKQLSGIIYESVGDSKSFARIRSKGDSALFGGYSIQDMKNKLNVPYNRPLADFLPTITIKAKDFANEITNFNIKKDSLLTEHSITNQHIKNNEDVRGVLLDRNIYPENLPPAEDIKKVERRLTSEQKKISKKSN